MRSLTLGVSPLPALALLLALLSPFSAHAQGGGFGLGPAQGTGSSFTGGTLDSQVTWDSGLGAIDHILGPTDQDLVISSPSGRNTILEANGTVNARMTLTTSYVEFTDPIRSPDGSASAPAYSFSNDTDTGIYLQSTGNVGITCGGTVRAVFNSAGLVGQAGLRLYGFTHLVTARTDVAASPFALSGSYSRSVLTNEGSTAENHHDLPTAVAGYTYTFVVQDSDGIQINAATGDTIRVAGSVSAGAGNIASATIGDTVTLVAINATEWVAIHYVGTWTVT